MKLTKIHLRRRGMQCATSTSFNERHEFVGESFMECVVCCNWKLQFVSGGHKEALDKD